MTESMKAEGDRYRLPAATRLGRVALQVADLGRSIDYYERVLGLRVLARAEAVALLAAHGDDTPLVELRERPGARPSPRGGRLGLYHFAVLLPDRASLGRFIAHLASDGVRAGMSDHLVSEAVYLHDPDGLGIEVYADRPRDSWLREGGQIVMATEPLDAGAVVRAAGPAEWAGMPAGTRIGHVHLQVGDLEAAARFYHEGLGLDRTVWTYPGALFLSAGGYHHHLGTNTWAQGAVPAGADEARLLEWIVLVPGADDVEDVARSLSRIGAGVTRGGGDALTVDPWGTPLRVSVATA